MKYSKYWYQVFECSDNTDAFSYDESKVLFESEKLDEAHFYAYKCWQQDNNKAYTIIQPYDGSCRGGYGAWTEDE